MAEKDEKQMDQNSGEELDPQSDEIIDMNEAIKLLNTTRSTFYRWVREGKVKGMKVGRQWRFYREEIERFLKGEEPQIDLPANIDPLIENLRERIKQFEGEDTPLPDEPKLSPVVEAVNLMIRLAVMMKASDIHLAPLMKADNTEKIAILRYRLDGMLNTIAEFDIRLLPPIISRWKILSNCDISEKQSPQDGRLVARVADTDGDTELRVCFLPTGMGESLTVRIMSSSAMFALLTLDKMDFAPHDRERIMRWIKAPWGIIVVSGPTGSGRTTTLYACLNQIARPEVKIVTVEYPVEVLLPWAVQVPVQPNTGLTYAAALRAALRSDPDIIMVGEVRDDETLEVAQECALTGHLVMTTMHVNDSVHVLKRMLELGGALHVISASTKLIVAQRLVRMLCPDCSREYNPSSELLDQAAKIAYAGGLGWNSLPKNFREPVGCPKCRETGYKGRNLIVETLEVTQEIISALERGASDDELRSIAVEQGMTTMAADGIRRAASGETSLDEAIRVAGK